MAINLNPGADASLVAQAHRTGMAGVPKDLSGTFRAMADSYSAAMGKVGAAAKEAAEVVGKVAGEAAKDAIETLRDYRHAADELVISEVEEVKGDLKSARTEYPFGSPERRKAVAAAKEKRDKLFGTAKIHQENRIARTQALANKSYDAKASGGEDGLNIATVQATTLNGEPIKSGPHKGLIATKEKNEDGDWQYSFSGSADYTGELPSPVLERNVSGLLRTDAGEEAMAINNIDLGYYKAGGKGELARPNVVLREIGDMVTEENLPSLLYKNIGNTGRSFMDALKSDSPLSKDIWKELSVLENVDGYKDIDGVKGVSAGDFADKEGENYKILISTFDPAHKNYNYEAAKEAFVEETSATIITGNLNAYNAWEKKNRKITTGSGSDTGNISLGLGRTEGMDKTQIWKKPSEVKAVYNDIVNLGKGKKEGFIPGWDGARTYQYRKVKDSNYWNYQVWDAEKGMFITQPLGGKSTMSTNDVIKDLNIPTTTKQNFG